MRFVLLEHDHPFLHWDLMLDTGDVLRTWRLPTEPAAGSNSAVEAEPLADHRRRYLEYEGPVSGGRGCVTRRDAGTYHVVDEAPERLTIEFAGRVLNGRYTLNAGDPWTLQRSSRNET